MTFHTCDRMFIKFKTQDDIEYYINTDKIVTLVPGSEEMTDALVNRGYFPYWQKAILPEVYTLVTCEGLNLPVIVFESIKDVVKKIEDAKRFDYLYVTSP